MIHPCSKALLFLACAAPFAARAEPVQVTYAAYAGGLNVLNMEAIIDVTASQYRARINWRTAGAFSLAVTGGQDSSVEGHFAGDHAVPHRFTSSGMLRGEHRVTDIEYQGGNPVIRQLLPPIDKEREPVPPAMQQGTIDTFSAMAELIHQVSKTGRCDGAARTFDGHRVAELRAHTVAQEFLPPYSRSSFSGNALHCSFDGRMLAGFTFDEDRARQQRDQHGSAWFAALRPGGPMVPVRVVFHTRWFGDATLYITERQ